MSIPRACMFFSFLFFFENARKGGPYLAVARDSSSLKNITHISIGTVRHSSLREFSSIISSVDLA